MILLWGLIAIAFYINTFFLPTPPLPEIKYGEFPFYLGYEINGQLNIIEDILICEYKDTVLAGDGSKKYIEWEVRSKNGNEITRLFRSSGDYLYLIKLFDGVIQDQGGTRIYCDIGRPDYYLGYRNYKDYCPGRVYISGPLAFGIIDEDELWNKYNIRISKANFSQPLIGNGITESSKYKDVARLAVKGVILTPHEPSYPPGAKQIVFTWKNDTNKQIICKQSFYIQKKVNGKWQNVYHEMAVSFPRENIILEPHTQITYTYDINKYTKNIPAGEYRVVTPALVPLKRKTFEARVFCGEFIIEE